MANRIVARTGQVLSQVDQALARSAGIAAQGLLELEYGEIFEI